MAFFPASLKCYNVLIDQVAVINHSSRQAEKNYTKQWFRIGFMKVKDSALFDHVLPLVASSIQVSTFTSHTEGSNNVVDGSKDGIKNFYITNSWWEYFEVIGYQNLKIKTCWQMFTAAKTANDTLDSVAPNYFQRSNYIDS